MSSSSTVNIRIFDVLQLSPLTIIIIIIIIGHLAGEGHRMVASCAWQMAHLQRPWIEWLESSLSWSSHLLDGRPGRYYHDQSSRLHDVLTWRRTALFIMADGITLSLRSSSFTGNNGVAIVIHSGWWISIRNNTHTTPLPSGVQWWMKARTLVGFNALFPSVLWHHWLGDQEGSLVGNYGQHTQLAPLFKMLCPT